MRRVIRLARFCRRPWRLMRTAMGHTCERLSLFEKGLLRVRVTKDGKARWMPLNSSQPLVRNAIRHRAANDHRDEQIRHPQKAGEVSSEETPVSGLL